MKLDWNRLGVLLLCLFSFAWPTRAQDFDILGEEAVKGRLHTMKVEWKMQQSLNGQRINPESEEWTLTLQVEYDKYQRIRKEYHSLRCGNGEYEGKTWTRMTIDNQLIEVLSEKTGEIIEKRIHTKGENGRLIRSDYYAANGQLQHQWIYTYEIDGQGNWIRREASLRIPYDPDHYDLKFIERRVITYY